MRKIAANEPASSIRISLEQAHLAEKNARLERDLAQFRVSALEAALASSPSAPECTCSRSPIKGYARPDEPCPAHLAEAELTTRGTRDRLWELLAARDRTIEELKREKDETLAAHERAIDALMRERDDVLAGRDQTIRMLNCKNYGLSEQLRRTKRRHKREKDEFRAVAVSDEKAGVLAARDRTIEELRRERDELAARLAKTSGAA